MCWYHYSVKTACVIELLYYTRAYYAYDMSCCRLLGSETDMVYMLLQCSMDFQQGHVD
jgi:hypothetical protein